jgi:hypothetical protein
LIAGIIGIVEKLDRSPFQIYLTRTPQAKVQGRCREVVRPLVTGRSRPSYDNAEAKNRRPAKVHMTPSESGGIALLPKGLATVCLRSKAKASAGPSTD